LISKRIDIRSFVRIDFNAKIVLIGLACGVAMLFLDIFVTNALTFVFGESTTVQQSNELLTGLTTTPAGFAAVAASLTLAGICEEFAFRGFLQNAIFKALNTTKFANFSFAVAVVISAAIFGLFHFDQQGVYILSAFISGVALGYIYHRWGYVAAAISHASMNLIVLALLMLGI
jgi:membrane protease YdiL (CAAX protease family)